MSDSLTVSAGEAQPSTTLPSTIATTPTAANPGSTDDNTPFTPFPRRFPDDLLVFVCAELDNLKMRCMFLFRPLAEFKALQNTLLAIQRTSRAGWKAATPYVWRNLTFTRADDYLSFFAPITRFSNRTPVRKTLPAKIRQAASLANGDEGLPEDLSRFFRATEYIHTIRFEAIPPLSVKNEIALAHGIAVEVLGKPYYLGQAVHLEMDEVCAIIGAQGHKRDVKMLGSFIVASKPARIDLWNIDASDEEENTRFWNDFEILNPKSQNTPLVLHDLISGQLSDIPYKNLTISMSPGWHWMYDEGEASRTLAIDLGIWVYDTVLDEYGSADPTADGDEVQAQMTVTGWSGCPCKCDEDMYPLTNTRLVLAQIKQYATNMSRNIILSQGPTMAERIQIFFNDERLKLTVALCEGYKARILEELAKRQ